MSPSRTADDLLTDPLQTLHKVLEREVGRAELRRLELAEIGNALHQLSRQARRPPGTEPAHAWEPVAADLAPALLSRLYETLDGPLRTCVRTLGEGPGLDAEVIRAGQQRVADGLEQRALYPLDVLEDPSGRDWLEAWAAVGEQQRLAPQPLSDFAVFGDQAVMAVEEWGDAASNYVLIRDPMLVAAFTRLFDQAYAAGLPVPGLDPDDGDRRLLRLLGTGLKDEAIARYLGVSLRTVRRRVSLLMEQHGAQTRFQLGAAAATQGLVTGPQRPH